MRQCGGCEAWKEWLDFPPHPSGDKERRAPWCSACGPSPFDALLAEPEREAPVCPPLPGVPEDKGPGWIVYAYGDETGRLLYVGETALATAEKRDREHQRESLWRACARRYRFCGPFATRNEALVRELKTMDDHAPLFNKYGNEHHFSQTAADEYLAERGLL